MKNKITDKTSAHVSSSTIYSSSFIKYHILKDEMNRELTTKDTSLIIFL